MIGRTSWCWKLTSLWLSVRENMPIRLLYAAMTASNWQPRLKQAAFRNRLYSLLVYDTRLNKAAKLLGMVCS